LAADNRGGDADERLAYLLHIAQTHGTNDWSSLYWTPIHVDGVFYPDIPTEADKQEIIAKWTNLRVPCNVCKAHWAQKMGELKNHVGSRVALFRFSVDLHNDVNKYQKQPNLVYEDITYEEAAFVYTRVAQLSASLRTTLNCLRGAYAADVPNAVCVDSMDWETLDPAAIWKEHGRVAALSEIQPGRNGEPAKVVPIQLGNKNDVSKMESVASSSTCGSGTRLDTVITMVLPIILISTIVLLGITGFFLWRRSSSRRAVDAPVSHHGKGWTIREHIM